MAYQKLAVLTYNLHIKTEDGTINWEETAIDGVYQASLANYTVTISLQESRTAEGNDVKISIINNEGSEVESFLDIDLEEGWFQQIDVYEAPYNIMNNIYEVARRTALGSEKAINDILSELSDEEVPF